MPQGCLFLVYSSRKIEEENVAGYLSRLENDWPDELCLQGQIERVNWYLDPWISCRCLNWSELLPL